MSACNSGLKAGMRTDPPCCGGLSGRGNGSGAEPKRRRAQRGSVPEVAKILAPELGRAVQRWKAEAARTPQRTAATSAFPAAAILLVPCLPFPSSPSPSPFHSHSTSDNS